MPPRILRLPHILETTGLSASTIYAMMAEKRFPRPIRLGKRAVGWPSNVMEEWLSNRPTSRGEAILNPTNKGEAD